MQSRLFKAIKFTLILIVGIVQLANGQVPSDLMENCNQWKITYPTGVEDKTLCNEPNNEFFYVHDSLDAIVFRAPIRSDNGTTPNSSYIRSELRERVADGKSDIYWTTEGKHFVYVKQAITHLPINKSHLVATQIHGDKDDGIDDAMVLRLEDKHLFLSFNGGKLRSDITIKTDYELGTVHEVIFVIENGKHYCYYSEGGNLLDAYNQDTASAYLVKDGNNEFVMDLDYDQSYFKIGNYTQSNPDKEGEDTDDLTNYGEVVVYDFSVKHDVGEVVALFVTPKEIDIRVGGEVQLSYEVSPSGSTSDVSYESLNSAIAKVGSDGKVTGIKEGIAKIWVKTGNGNIGDTCLVKVYNDPMGENVALGKTAISTDIHDGEHEASNLIDGIVSTRWSVSGFPKTVVIDLGEVSSIGRSEMSCYKDRAYKYKVAVSNSVDGPYEEVVDRSNNRTPGYADNPIVDIFPNVQARYVQLEVIGSEIYEGSWISLLEFALFESSLSNVEKRLMSSQNVSIWPNPTSGKVFISAEKDYHSVSVYDQNGRMVMAKKILGGELDISGLSEGLYMIQLWGEINSTAIRVIKR